MQSQLNHLYAAYGRAVIATNRIEKTVTLFIAMWYFLKQEKKEGSFEKKYEELIKKSFGQRMQIGLKEGAIPKDWKVALEGYRKLRNNLVHEYLDTIVFSLLTKKEPVNTLILHENVAFPTRRRIFDARTLHGPTIALISPYR